MKRKEIPDKYKWDLKKILQIKNINKFYIEMEDISHEINKLRKKTTANIENFQKYLQLSQKLSIISSKLSSFLYNTQSKDTTIAKSTEELLKFETIDSKISSKLFWTTNEIINNKKKIRKYLETDKLKDYKITFERIFRSEKHRLSDESEKLVSEISQALGAPGELFTSLTDGDFKFNDAVDSKKKKHKLTQGTHAKLYNSKDDKLRETSYKNFWKTYYQFRNSLSNAYYYNVLTANKISKIYKFKNTLESELFSDNVDEKFYNNLINYSKKYSYLNKKYLEIKLKLLKIPNPTPWMLNKPLFKDSSKEFTIEQAHTLLRKALAPLGNDYSKKIDFILENKCIDYMPNDGKRSGAYSYGVWEELPYILMNWNSKFRDVSTLIHEMGHSIHSLYSQEKQPYQHCGYPIFLAEIASITNEMLLIKYLIKNNKDKEFKKSIINSSIKDFIATVFRQLQFAEFEQWSHTFVEDGNVLTAENISKKCKELNNEYYPRPSTMNYDDDYQGLWGLYVPHFYRDFYVYKYAIGMICACAIVSKIYEDKSYYKKYLLLLKNGNRDWPLDILKKIDIDLNNNKTYDNAFSFLSKMINDLENLI